MDLFISLSYLPAYNGWQRSILITLPPRLLLLPTKTIFNSLSELIKTCLHRLADTSVTFSGCLQKWDPNLKLVAEGYAAKCIWNHNPELEDTGENLYAGTGPLDLRAALEKWFLDPLSLNCACVLQMVWADTHRVGCAFHLCDTMEGLDWDRVSFLVCNYYPAGNYEGVRPYVEGDWCSRCPENLQKCENSLCGKSTVVTPPDLCSSTSAFYFRTLFLLMYFFIIPDTVEEEDEDDDDVTADPMLTTGESSPDATTDPLQPTDDDVLPTTPDFPVESTTADGIPSVPTVHFASSTEDTPPPHTTAEATKPPSAPPTTLATLINKIGPDTREEEKEQEKEEEEKLNETPHKEEKGVKRVVGSIINKDSSAAQNSAGSMSSPSVLLACLTAILIVRL
uniref:Peptidase inhibitor 16 n=1 Tax=Maylandia zebra TaxID=106582 RepID=A0A3P9DNY4_9CICH